MFRCLFLAEECLDEEAMERFLRVGYVDRDDSELVVFARFLGIFRVEKCAGDLVAFGPLFGIDEVDDQFQFRKRCGLSHPTDSTKLSREARRVR